MVIHVGIDPEKGELSYYDDSATELSNYNEVKKKNDVKIEPVKYKKIEKVSIMFDEVKTIIRGELGCVCIFLYAYYGNKLRDKFIESGLKAGFKNVEIINRGTVFYLNAMSQVNYKPSKGEVIWIKMWNYFYVWQTTDIKAKFIGQWWADPSKMTDVQEIIKASKLNHGPNIVLCDVEIDKTIFSEMSQCRYFCYKRYMNWSSTGSLLKARITAGDNDISHLDTLNYLSRETSITWGERNLVSFKPGHQLPITYCQKLSNNQNGDTLKITQWNEEESFKLPHHEEIVLTLKIDKNEIHTVTLNEQRNIESGEKPLAPNTLFDKLQTMLKSSFLQTPKTTPKNQYVVPETKKMSDAKFDATGIDLGTSRCCVAVNRKNGINTIPLGNTGERLLPSYVSYDEKNVKCGQIVIDRLRHFAKYTVFDSKRIIGRNMSDIEIDSNWSFQLIEPNKKPLIKVNGFDCVKHLQAEQISAELLKHVKQKAEDFQGIPLFNAVITVPAAFTEEQKNATIEAAKIAGWKNIHLLPEPVAAAFAYFIDHPINNNSTVLLFDLGGGTLDVCIFKIASNEIQIISNTGDTKLGGRDFDTVLINYFTNLLNTNYGIIIQDEKKYKLMIKCQQIKETLSLLTSCGLDIDEFDPFQDGIVYVSRIEFEKMTIHLYNRIQNTLNAALFNSGFQPNEIEKVLLVGGGSRMPMIKKLLQEIFPNAQQCCHENPDEVVAIGAAYFACNNAF